MRIIGGEFKGRKLSPLNEKKIRPTADKTREAIFNIIGHKIRGKKILDFFAGTGAMGIEAISRGAEFSLFADNDKNAISLIRKNIGLCNIEKKTRVVKNDILRNFYAGGYGVYTFDIFFLDPPYDQGMIAPTIENISKIVVNDSEVVIVCEHSSSERFPEKISKFHLYEQRKYGRARVSFFNTNNYNE